MKQLSTKQKTYSLITLLVLIGLGFVWYFHHAKVYPHTDDAYINANIIHMAAQISGPVTKINVTNYQTIKKDQLLLEIDPRPFQIAIHQAEAQFELAKQKEQSANATVEAATATIKQREAELLLAQQNAKRMLKLVKTGQLSKQQGDEVNRNLRVAEATLNHAHNELAEAKAQLGDSGNDNADIRSAKATLDKAKLNLTYTRITAPADGTLINFNTRVGDMIQSGQELFAVVENNQWWVDANYKETQLERIKPGQTATIETDMYPHHPFKGKVYQVSPGSGASFSLLPPENATGNWVKVTQRFPVKILLFPTAHYPLRVGASADIVIDTKH